jgi:hypothetical protein
LKRPSSQRGLNFPVAALGKGRRGPSLRWGDDVFAKA